MTEKRRAPPLPNEERFGQCVPSDATIGQRLEACAALLNLGHPSLLLEALFDAGIRVMTKDEHEHLKGSAK